MSGSVTPGTHCTAGTPAPSTSSGYGGQIWMDPRFVQQPPPTRDCHKVGDNIIVVWCGLLRGLLPTARIWSTVLALGALAWPWHPSGKCISITHRASGSMNHLEIVRTKGDEPPCNHHFRFFKIKLPCQWRMISDDREWPATHVMMEVCCAVSGLRTTEGLRCIGNYFLATPLSLWKMSHLNDWLIADGESFVIRCIVL